MKWLKNLSIAVKVSIAPTVAILGLLVVGAAGYVANNSLSESLREVGLTRVPQIIQSEALAQRLTGIHAAVNQSLAWEGAGFKASKVEALDRQILASLDDYSLALENATRQEGLTPRQADLLRGLAEDFGKYSANAKQALDIKSGMVANAASFMTTMDESYAKCMASLTELVSSMAQDASKAVETGAVLAARNQSVLLVVLLFSSVLTLLAALVMKAILVGPMLRAAELAGAIAGGDLTRSVQVESKDETGALLLALSDMQTRLIGIVGNVRRGSDGVAVASAEIAQGTQDLSDRTENQASALEQTAASMEELNSTVTQNAHSAREASLLARDTSTVAAQGGEIVARVVSNMKGINDSSQKIADIISVIDGIAFQTNILALNAAVEAARAGEQGRGFAVVASEVRALAGRSAKAAKEIKELISDSVQQVEQGSTLVDQAGETMNDVVASIRKLNDIVGEISAASAEQSAGVGEVSSAVTDMDRTTQQNAALVEQMTAAAASLKSQANDLVQAVAVFKLSPQASASVVALKAPPVQSGASAALPPTKKKPPKVNNAPSSSGSSSKVEALAPPDRPVVRVANEDGWETF
jgi:methyl-accepting chemotaxis protein